MAALADEPFVENSENSLAAIILFGNCPNGILQSIDLPQKETMQKTPQLDEEKLQQTKDQRYTTLYGTTIYKDTSSRDWDKELEKRIVCLKVTLAVLFMCMVMGLLIIPLLS